MKLNKQINKDHERERERFIYVYVLLVYLFIYLFLYVSTYLFIDLVIYCFDSAPPQCHASEEWGGQNQRTLWRPRLACWEIIIGRCVAPNHGSGMVDDGSVMELMIHS